ncbi:MAG TPA: hypothetical protein VJ859_06935 [Allosphingosinicella sp.]|nr:hypothetical protein [Allosphingosinicella sp.]
MRKTLIMAALASLGMAAVAGPSAARPLKPEQEARIKPIGKPASCIPLRQIDSTRVRDDRTIDFYMLGHTVYRNRLPYRCPQLGFEERFSYKTSLSQLCSTDTITVLTSPGISRGASCGLGEFQKIAGAPK